MTVALVWAQSADGTIGRDGTLPWHLPEDLSRFRGLTRGAPVIMGRRTWDSLPPRFRPLPGRHNIVLTRDAALRAEGATVVTGVGRALSAAAVGRAGDESGGGQGEGPGTVWVIGGAQVYAAFADRAERLEITDVDVVVGGDTPAPVVGALGGSAGWRCTRTDPTTGWAVSSTGLRYRFRTLVRVPAAVTAADGFEPAGR